MNRAEEDNDVHKMSPSNPRIRDKSLLLQHNALRKIAVNKETNEKKNAPKHTKENKAHLQSKGSHLGAQLLQHRGQLLPQGSALRGVAQPQKVERGSCNTEAEETLGGVDRRLTRFALRVVLRGEGKDDRNMEKGESRACAQGPKACAQETGGRDGDLERGPQNQRRGRQVFNSSYLLLSCGGGTGSTAIETAVDARFSQLVKGARRYVCHPSRE